MAHLPAGGAAFLLPAKLKINLLEEDLIALESHSCYRQQQQKKRL
jgi:hypothetical protein